MLLCLYSDSNISAGMEHFGDISTSVFFFASTTIHKILETNSSFYVKQRTTGKVQFLFFSYFLPILTNFSFWEEDWAPGYNSIKF